MITKRLLYIVNCIFRTSILLTPFVTHANMLERGEDPTPRCIEIQGLKEHLSTGKLVLVGEVHGTLEAPATFSQLICAALSTKYHVSVGLEFPADQAFPVQQFLESDGGTNAVLELVRTPFWSRRSQDGRTSTAMLDLLKYIRTLSKNHRNLSVFVIDQKVDQRASRNLYNRSWRMADRVRTEFMRRPDGIILTLTGNLHNILSESKARVDGEAANMAALLSDLEIISISLVGDGGSAWGCRPECKAFDIAKDPRTGELYNLAYERSPDGAAYSGTIRIGSTTASPPAIVVIGEREIVRPEIRYYNREDAKRLFEGFVKSDQSLRAPMAALLRSGKRESEEFQILARKQQVIDLANVRLLEGLVEKFGWPQVSSFGQQAVRGAFLVVQHGDVKLQEKLLPKIREAVEKGEGSPINLAYLEDRVLVRKGKPQVYGTQVQRDPKSGSVEPFPIQDLETVDARRKKIGLPSMRNYLDSLSFAR